jgi:primosomal protein N' (replication factor Y)
MHQIAGFLRRYLTNKAIVLGPTPKTITRVNNRYFYQIIIKYRQEPKLKAALDDVLVKSQAKQQGGLLISIDNEPLDFM